MRIYWRLALIACVWSAVKVVAAEEGLTSGLTLLRNVDARPGAMGEAFVAAPGEIQSLGFNPAGLAKISQPGLSATYLNGIFDDKFGVVSYAHPLSFGSIFVSGAYFDGGPIDINLSSGLQETRRAQQDTVGMIGFAVGRDGPVSLGATMKVFKFELAQQASAGGFAADAGLQWKSPLDGLSVGGAVQNVGSSIKYEVDKQPLPLTLRAGLAYALDLKDFKSIHDLPYQFLVTADGVQTKDSASSFNSGLEVGRDITFSEDQQKGHAALRGGYNSALKSVTAGMGFQMGGFSFDYAINLFQNSLSPSHRVTVGWRFASAPAETESGNQHNLNYKKI